MASLVVRCSSLAAQQAAPSAAASSSSRQPGVGVLTAARPHTKKSGGRQCPAPNVKAPLRRQSAFDEACVELFITNNPYPSCLLPGPDALLSCRIDQGILPLVDLSKLTPATLLRSLQAVESYVESTLTADRTVPSPLAFSPDFDAYLERALELASARPQGPAPFVLLLRILSHLRLGAEPTLTAAFQNYYQHFIVAFEDAVDRQPTSLTPPDYVTLFQAWAHIDLPVQPIKGHAFAANLKKLLSRSAFSVQECSQLLEALSALKARHLRYRMCSYQLADLAACLTHRAAALSDEQLLSVARSAAAFEWPTYQSLLPVLNSVCRQAVARERGPSGAAATRVLQAAVSSAGAMRPRLGAELEARVAGWRSEKQGEGLLSQA